MFLTYLRKPLVSCGVCSIVTSPVFARENAYASEIETHQSHPALALGALRMCCSVCVCASLIRVLPFAALSSMYINSVVITRVQFSMHGNAQYVGLDVVF